VPCLGRAHPFHFLLLLAILTSSPFPSCQCWHQCHFHLLLLPSFANATLYLLPPLSHRCADPNEEQTQSLKASSASEQPCCKERTTGSRPSPILHIPHAHLRALLCVVPLACSAVLPLHLHPPHHPTFTPRPMRLSSTHARSHDCHRRLSPHRRRKALRRVQTAQFASAVYDPAVAKRVVAAIGTRGVAMPRESLS